MIGAKGQRPDDLEQSRGAVGTDYSLVWTRIIGVVLFVGRLGRLGRSRGLAKPHLPEHAQ